MTVPRTTLITGATSGLGLETARQLLTRNDEHVVITARSRAKADRAIDTLLRETGADASRVEAVIVDFTVPSTVEGALSELADARIDGVVMNAGGVPRLEGGTFARTSQGLTDLFAMNVSGHAQLLYGLLDAGRLNHGASVVFASSEAARGIPAMGLATVTLPSLPGSPTDIVAGIARGDHLDAKVDVLSEYGLVKLIGSVWMTDLAARHGDDYRFYAISPGATTGTAGPDKMPPFVRFVMKYVMMPAFKLVGRAHAVDAGASRYLEGLEGTGLRNGVFYASPHPHLSGPIVEQEPRQQPLLADETFRVAVGEYLRGLVASLHAAA